MKHLLARATVGALLFSGISLHCYSETLEEIYKLALENDHTYKAAEANLKAGKENKNLGRAALLPQINGNYNWNDNHEWKDGNELNQDRTALVEVDTPAFGTKNSGYSVTLSQPLFNLAAWHGYKQLNYVVAISKVEFEAAKQSLILRTATAYFDALQADESLATAVAEEKAFAQQLEQSRKRFEVGLTAITEVHEAQAAYDSAVANRLIAEGQLGIAFEALEVITGSPIAKLSPLKTQFPVSQPEPQDRKEWVNFALENNLTLQSTSLNAKSARANVNVKKSDHLPTVTGSLSYSNNNYTDDVNQDIDTQSRSVSVTVNVPIFAGGSTSASRRQAHQEYLAAKENLYQAQRDTVQSARSSHLSVVTGVASVKARKQAITSNQSALDATQSGYEVGTRDLVDVLNAQRNLYRAQRDYQEALYTYILNTLSLKEVAGLLSDNDISELNKWLDETKSVSYSF